MGPVEGAPWLGVTVAEVTAGPVVAMGRKRRKELKEGKKKECRDEGMYVQVLIIQPADIGMRRKRKQIQNGGG